jgi:ABC-type sugar transport system ATPase subunit
MIMLDEPTAGVNPALTRSLLRDIQELRGEGMTIVFVEHDMDVVMRISDSVVCMAEGRETAEGPPASIGSNHAVIDAHHGRRGGGEGEMSAGLPLLAAQDIVTGYLSETARRSLGTACADGQCRWRPGRSDLVVLFAGCRPCG